MNSDPFDGTASKYYIWMERIKSQIDDFKLTPIQALILMTNNSKGDPQRYIAHKKNITAQVTVETIVEVINELTRRFGSTELISKQLMDRLMRVPEIKVGPNLAQHLFQFADSCEEILLNMEHCIDLSILNLKDGLRPVKEKLPHYLKQKWLKKVQEYQVANATARPSFKIFVEFVRHSAALALTTDEGDIEKRRDKEVARDRKPTYSLKKTSLENGHNNSKTYHGKTPRNGYDNVKKFCDIHKRYDHDTVDCREYLEMNPFKRLDVIKNTRRCINCLHVGHGSMNCQSKYSCRKCGKKHHTTLHFDHPDNNIRKNESASTAAGY